LASPFRCRAICNTISGSEAGDMPARANPEDPADFRLVFGAK
jgi:hypothetical protein